MCNSQKNIKYISFHLYKRTHQMAYMDISYYILHLYRNSSTSPSPQLRYHCPSCPGFAPPHQNYHQLQYYCISVVYMQVYTFDYSEQMDSHYHRNRSTCNLVNQELHLVQQLKCTRYLLFQHQSSSIHFRLMGLV